MSKFSVPDEDAEEHPDYDPYGQLGFGFEAYFKMMQIFACLFVLICIIMLPAFCYYYKYQGLLKSSHGYYNSAWMLGNMGFNKAACTSQYTTIDASQKYGCEVGYMQELDWAGIIPQGLDYSMTELPYSYCG